MKSLVNKIFKREAQQSTANQTFQGSWVQVRTNSKDKWASLKLPFTIGYHSDNDIFVNAPSMRQISKIVTEQHGRVLVVDAQNQSTHSKDTLSIFGIQIQGPYTARPDNLGVISKVWQTFKGQESEWVEQRVAPKWKKLLPKTTELRLVTSLLMANFDKCVCRRSPSELAVEAALSKFAESDLRRTPGDERFLRLALSFVLLFEGDKRPTFSSSAVSRASDDF